MNRRITNVRLHALGWLCLALAVEGCGSRKTYDDFVPSAGSALNALTTALDSWKKGQPPGKIDGDPVAIEIYDSFWEQGRKSGQQLTKYEILKEEDQGGPKVFTVRLTLENPAEQREVRYFVRGNNLLYVFAEKDNP